MKTKSASRSAFLRPRLLLSFSFFLAAILLALAAFVLYPGASVFAQESPQEFSRLPGSKAGFQPFAPLGGPTAAGQLIISEFRVRGPNGVDDEFIELANATLGQLAIQSTDGSTGLAVAADDGVPRCVVPNGTVIPAGGHFLCVNSVSYSLGGNSSGMGDLTYVLEIPDGSGIAIFNNSLGGANFSLANRLDAAGPINEANTLYREGAGLPNLTPFSIDYAWVRRWPGGCLNNCSDAHGPTSTQPQDTDNNASDFIFMDTNAVSAGGGQRLGAPGPKNLSGPGVIDGAPNLTLLDTCAGESSAPNLVIDATSDPPNNSTFGTYLIRRTFTNNSANPITRLRFRVVDINTFPATVAFADLRVRTSTAQVVTVDRPPCGSGTSNVTVRSTTLEQPPSQPNGGASNSTLAVTSITPGAPLAPGASVDVQFLLGVEQTGTARFCVIPESVPISASQVSCYLAAQSTPAPCGNAVLAEKFDGVTAPNLPAGWIAANAQGPAPHWVTSTSAPASSPNDAFIDDPTVLSDKHLDTPGIPIASAAAQLTFFNSYSFESGGTNFYDGGVVEVSSPNINGGAFTDITNAAVGGSFVAGGYNGTISSSFQNPLGGRMAWSGSSNGYILTTANLGPQVAGQTIKLRFRMGSDTSNPGGGWHVDDVSIVDGGCSKALNISTRMQVETGSNVLIAGFIVTGSVPKEVVIRGIGPSLSQFGIPGVLANPILELHASNGAALLQDDDWQNNSAQAARLSALGLAPSDPQEAAIVATLPPGAYTALLSGRNGTTGVGLVEVYGLESVGNDSQLANISTRGFVQSGDNVMIGGFILNGSGNSRVAVRGLGPSLGINPILADPTLELHDHNGTTLVANDNWQDDSTSAAQLTAFGIPLQNPNESGIFASLPPGNFTAILAGKNGGTGVGLVEVYNVH